MLMIMKIFVSKTYNFQHVIKACNSVKSSWQLSDLNIESRTSKSETANWALTGFDYKVSNSTLLNYFEIT